MNKLIMTVLAAMLASGAAYAQNNNNQNNNHRGGPPPNNNHGQPNPHPAPAAVHAGPAAHPGPAMAAQPHAMPAVPARNMGGRGAGNGRGNGPGNGPGRHHLPPGISIPTAHHSAPNWHGRSWGVGDVFILTGFDGPTIRDWNDYSLPTPRRGTHWIYVDGYYLMVGNRTGHIFAEVAADY